MEVLTGIGAIAWLEGGPPEGGKFVSISVCALSEPSFFDPSPEPSEPDSFPKSYSPDPFVGSLSFLISMFSVSTDRSFFFL